ncbi:MAG: class I SAM-dependent methyltransferase [bacterium]|nr:class I SAM-dependent methyltransferase [bacterium]
MSEVLHIAEGDEETLTFSRFPFITGVHFYDDQPRKQNVFLSFRLGFREDIGVISQKATPEVDGALEQAYESGSSLSTPIGEGSLNRPLQDEILRFLQEACGGARGKRFLEPGCGKGGLLKALRDMGAEDVEGCEPGGPQARWASQTHHLRIRNDFFRASDYSDRFDCVFHYGVLEHIRDPADFIAQNMAVLSPGGTVFVSVPGCQADFELGNFMTLAHEHYSYFTPASLKSLLAGAGLQDIEVREFQYSAGILCAWGKVSAEYPVRRFGVSVGHCRLERALLRTFGKTCRRHLAVLQERADRLGAEGKVIGLYGAPRALAGLLEFRTPPRNFDGDTAKHGAYFNGSPNPIEPPGNLIEKPVDIKWILPIHHDQAIREFLQREILPSRKMVLFSFLEMAREGSACGYERRI